MADEYDEDGDLIITAEDVTLVAPDLSAENEDRIDMFVDYARAQVSPGITNQKFATILLAAHLMVLSNRGGEGGKVKREQLGDLSTEYFGSDGGGDSLDDTTYGRMYSSLLDFGGGFVGVSVV